MDDWGDELTDEERDALIEKIADHVSRRRLETPALLFLEMHKPVSFLAGQSLVVMSPFVAPLVGVGNLRSASRLLARRDNVERLIRRIEERAVERGGDSAPKGSPDAAR